jgi:methionyl-tRNA synthetase
MRSNPKSYARKLLSALCVLAVKTKPYLRALPVLSRLPYEDPRPHHRHRRFAIRERPPAHRPHRRCLPARRHLRARNLRPLRGKEVLFVCGSDEHGAAITMRAMKEGTTPRAIVDKYHALMHKAFVDFGIQFDIYHRTSSDLHKETSQDFFLGIEQERRFHGEHGRAVLRCRGQAIPRGPLHHRHLSQLRQSGCIRRSMREVRQRAQPEGPHQPAQHTERQQHRILRPTKHWYLPMERSQEWMTEWINTGMLDGDAARSRRMETASIGPMQQLAEGRLASYVP